MAATELIAVGATAANSADFTLASGEQATVGLFGFTTLLPSVKVEIKDSAGEYQSFAVVKRAPVVVNGPGTFRARRLAGASGGVFRG
jgi:hypothetical protein